MIDPSAGDPDEHHTHQFRNDLNAMIMALHAQRYALERGDQTATLENLRRMERAVQRLLALVETRGAHPGRKKIG
ncbi:hypothetical protein [Pseudoxanthomonas sp. X-1]|uniref:hypothetical protein n=1 Tax=Pseudoxanthomonas sp. X-1 TaxID=2571115 RepID=UPI00110A6D7A|nr:hypothetical protein [Pseudoxanthomonas sp. X-1]TMN24754.1 hypothetical protein FF950_04815 [Pseudoxanthomonas sp. X-1]UAY73160.1 hypothetical protein LAJ50_11590 [Pseudoxanthomonas sp. X-1]